MGNTAMTGRAALIENGTIYVVGNNGKIEN